MDTLDLAFQWVIYGSLAGMAVAMMMLISAKVGNRSTRWAAIFGATCGLLYVGAGVAGAVHRVNSGPATPPEGTKAPPPTEGKAPVDPALDAAAKVLSDAVTGADWEAAAKAHAALQALDATHPALAPAWTKIEQGRAAAGGSEASGSDGGGSGTGSGEAAETGPATSTGADGDGSSDTSEAAADAEPKPKRRRRRRRRPGPAAGGGGGAGGAAGEGGGPAPTEEPPAKPTPTAEPPAKPTPAPAKDEPKPEPAADGG